MRDWYTKIVRLLKKITVSVYKKTGVEPEQFKENEKHYFKIGAQSFFDTLGDPTKL